jgi:hypothetical protein
MRKSVAEASRRYNDRHPIRRMLINVRHRAKVNGLPFDLTEEDIVIPSHCPVLGIELIRSEIATDNSPSIDRISCEGGYTKENSRVISQRANRIKNDASIKDLVDVVMYLVRELR